MLHETGLTDRVERVSSVVAFAGVPNPAVLGDNPLGKIPALVLDDGTSLFDSRVICEYLDTLHSGPPLLPRSGRARFDQLRWQALGDGMTEILIVWLNELIRPEGPSGVITRAFDRKLRASFARLEEEAETLSRAEFGLGHIALVSAIGQVDFRFLGSRWKDAFPRLAAWHEDVLRRPSVAATIPVDDPTARPAGFKLSVSPIDFMNEQK